MYAEYSVRDYAGMSCGEYALGIPFSVPFGIQDITALAPVLVYAMKTPTFSQLDRE